ncbi:MAG: bifunctional transaldolase/phosoglucose isomerase [Actinobacteria bacterium]|nr:bifunctional transaldolase/phosoglucose isomerase [Actinomycetota bacterium]
MTVTVGVNERLAALTEAGTSVWLDQIRRGMIESGELQRLIDEDSLRGVTSNPSIFEKAILGSSDYDEQVRELAEQGLGAREIYDEIAVRDVQMGADVLRPVFDELGGDDGFVSLEVGPEAANDTEETLRQARDYWRRLDRPNCFIKIPGTPAGVPAIEQAIFEGINVNVTLLFAVSAYEAVAEAYIRGLERRREAGESLDVHSVASFFVSRVDSEVDKRLEAAGGHAELLGTAGLWNARAAYVRFKELFYGKRFAELREAGAAVQRPLWASTGVKNPHYSDVMYVEGLVAQDTVNTMPMPTLLAAGEKLDVTGATADVAPDDVERAMGALAEAGIDIDDVTAKLLDDGVELFVQALDKLLAGVESKREAVTTGRPETFESSMPEDLEPAVAERVRKATEESVARRVWRKDETLWGGPGPEIGDRLGWLTVSDQMLERAGELRAFAEACRADGLRDAVLLGMGGSSLAPEVMRESFEKANGDGGLRLHVLDSTDPGAVLETERAIEMAKTLFLVSSKSGGTIETLSQFRYFHERMQQAVGAGAGKHFVAITDPGTSLVELARENDFLHVFQNDPDIGGRYSALSYFGMVPAALMGVDVVAVLERAQVAEQACQHYDSTASNSGLWLGLAMGELALHRRDKLTFAVAEPIGSFGLWVEQLVAESTGKQGRGILPVAGEPLGPPDVYSDDRVFVHIQQKDAPEAGFANEMAELAKAGHPTFTINAEGPEDLGRIFFFAEFATAVSGWVLGINPFDQPNVQEAKDNTAKVLEEYARDRRLPDEPNAADEGLRSLLQAAQPPNYFAIMGYVQPSDRFDRAIDGLRTAIRDATRATTTFGYGPRFLHSTGQFHKGGPRTGVFLQLVHDGDEDVEIPGAGYTFGTLKNAQATGDLQTLRAHGLPAERIRLEGDPAEAAASLTSKIKEML